MNDPSFWMLNTTSVSVDAMRRVMGDLGLAYLGVLVRVRSHRTDNRINYVHPMPICLLQRTLSGLQFFDLLDSQLRHDIPKLGTRYHHGDPLWTALDATRHKSCIYWYFSVFLAMKETSVDVFGR
jgi:hypothetical protein